jgi:hypothetical protein
MSLRTLLIYQKERTNETSGSTKKKSCWIFEKEWLPEIISTEVPSSKHRQEVKIGDIFIHRETDDVLCSIFSEANVSPIVKSERVETGLPRAEFEAKCTRGSRY